MSARPAPDDADPLGYYALLGISPQSTMDEIQAAYRRQAKRCHPIATPTPKLRSAWRGSMKPTKSWVIRSVA